MPPLGGQEATREHNHLKIWGIAAGVGLVAAWVLKFIFNLVVGAIGIDFLFYLAYGIIPYPFFFIFLWLLTAGGIAGFFYMKGTFATGGEPAYGGAPGLAHPTMGGAAGAAGAAAGAAGVSPQAVTSAEGELFPFHTALTFDGRTCQGDLYLDAGRLCFVVLKDQSAIAANAGKAVARQFGLIGLLIGAIVSAVRAKKVQAERDNARAETAGMTLDEKVAHNPRSFALTPGEIQFVKKSFWTGNQIRSHAKKYVIMEMAPGLQQGLAQWCAAHGVENKGM